jgi:ADP-ribose pyrophosphatase YjhB (NUDIX family)
MPELKINYCSQCGSAQIRFKIPQGDNLPRYVCEECQTIHYQNPKVVAGCVPEWQDQILLCRRGIEPRYGFWTLPAGFMENHETIEQAAMRETWEEAHVQLQQLSLYGLFSLPHVSQIYVMFRAQISELTFQPTTESLEVQLFHQEDIPWNEIAFPVVERTLMHYFQDRILGQFPVHLGEIMPRSAQQSHPII